MLSSPHPETRRAGAEVLQKRYAEDPKSLGDHGEAYWKERIGRAVGKRLSEGLTILDSPRCSGGEAGGGGMTQTCKLDDFWTVDIGVSTRGDETLFHVSEPRRRVERIEVEPPADFTGIWTTYSVDGAVYQCRRFRAGAFVDTACGR